MLRLSTTPSLKSNDYPTNEYRAVTGFNTPKSNAFDGALNLAVTGAKAGTQGEVVLDLLYRGDRQTRKVPAVCLADLPMDLRPAGRTEGNVRHQGRARLVQGVGGDSVRRVGEHGLPEEGKDQVPGGGRGAPYGSRQPSEGYAGQSSFFASDKADGRVIYANPPTQWEQPEVQAEKWYQQVLKVQPLGQVTPIADAIKEALTGNNVFKESEEFRSLVVITDGAHFGHCRSGGNCRRSADESTERRCPPSGLVRSQRQRTRSGDRAVQNDPGNTTLHAPMAGRRRGSGRKPRGATN